MKSRVRIPSQEPAELPPPDPASKPQAAVVGQAASVPGVNDAGSAAWVRLTPWAIDDHSARIILRRCARRLAHAGENGIAGRSVAAIRAREVAAAKQQASGIAPALIFCVNVLCDLRAQGWALRVDRGGIAALPPTQGDGSVVDDKARVRAAHLVERDAQLGQPAVRRFVREMERRRLYRGTWHSIFSLMRDGHQLAATLREAAALRVGDERQSALRDAVDPYVQVVTPGAACEFTGLPLSDVWRYFRHTWATTYQSTPGRKMFFLIRDRAALNHPVVGIGALGNAIVQLSARDEWIGWTAPRFIGELRERPTAAWARWLRDALATLIGDIYADDFLSEGLLCPEDLIGPTPATVARLTAFARRSRQTHRLYPASEQHKHSHRANSVGDEPEWARLSETHLFRSKRATALAELLEAKHRLQTAGFTRATAAGLRRALSDGGAIQAIQRVLRYSKAAHVGVNMMDITVCGAVAPYNHLLGGKLVALLMASPDVVAAYNGRYRRASSVIASSMAGRPIRRAPRLVLMGTTSLYGAGSSQYNRLRMPAAAAGGAEGEELAYVLVGRTVGYGSYHFSRETMAALEPMLRQKQRGRQVNSIFGEGVNPKLRKVRGALDAAGLPSELLLQHGSPRLIYVVPLAANFREVLLGTSRRPRYLVPDHPGAAARIVEYWRRRWLERRVEQEVVLDAVASHSLGYPVRHGARVPLPASAEEAGPLFTTSL